MQKVHQWRQLGVVSTLHGSLTKVRAVQSVVDFTVESHHGPWLCTRVAYAD